ncbi:MULTISPECIES: hypothetical protein [unclassified Luteococcus]|uniref:hypothetical protein n=1 Tax=unclassified Luteococcus TaxID=2639923 RepID=UPI00313DFE8C
MTMYLVGGGPAESLDSVHDQFVESAKKRGTRIAIALLGTQEEVGEALAGYADPISQRWPEAEIVPVWLDDEPDPKENTTAWPQAPEELAALVVAGGWTPGYLEALRPHRDLIAKLVRRGVPYLGFSAGAMVVGKRAIVGGWKFRGRQIVPEVWGEGLEEFEMRDGLGLIGPAVDVHGDVAGLGAGLAALEKGEVTTVVTIDEGTCLVIDPVSGRTTVEGHQRIHWLTKEGTAIVVRHESSAAEQQRHAEYLTTEREAAEHEAAARREAERQAAEEKAEKERRIAEAREARQAELAEQRREEARRIEAEEQARAEREAHKQAEAERIAAQAAAAEATTTAEPVEAQQDPTPAPSTSSGTVAEEGSGTVAEEDSGTVAEDGSETRPEEGAEPVTEANSETVTETSQTTDTDPTTTAEPVEAQQETVAQARLDEEYAATPSAEPAPQEVANTQADLPPEAESGLVGDPSTSSGTVVQEGSGTAVQEPARAQEPLLEPFDGLPSGPVDSAPEPAFADGIGDEVPVEHAPEEASPENGIQIQEAGSVTQLPAGDCADPAQDPRPADEPPAAPSDESPAQPDAPRQE